MKYQKSKHENDELLFFYGFLYQYEKDANHKGYNSRYLSKDLRAVIDNHQKDIKKNKSNNLILYTGKTVVADFLRHLRNAVAHCNIQSVTEKNTFILYDEDRSGKCTMYGSINKPLFYKLISEINKTRRQ